MRCIVTASWRECKTSTKAYAEWAREMPPEESRVGRNFHRYQKECVMLRILEPGSLPTRVVPRKLLPFVPK